MLPDAWLQPALSHKPESKLIAGKNVLVLITVFRRHSGRTDTFQGY